VIIIFKYLHNVIIIFKYLHYVIIIRIIVVIEVIKCDYYLLSVYEIMTIFYYYLNLYAILINAVITIYASLNKVRFHLLHNSRLSTIDDHCLIG
jgi:hypothetical protein